MTKPHKTILILTDDKPGHVSQSFGIARSLESAFELDKREVKLKIRFKGLRFLMRFLANYIPTRLLGFTLPLFYKFEGRYDNCSNPIIVSSGGNTLYANIVINAATNGLNLYSGTPKQFSTKLIDLIYTVVPQNGLSNNIVLDLPPVNIDPLEPNFTANTYALLIGGDGAGYKYTTVDWNKLIQGLEALSKEHGIKWLITTSRRSGEEIEHLLENAFDKSYVSQLVLYRRKPEKIMSQYLQLAEAIFCTEDSLTMVSEAIYSGKKVYTLMPEAAAPDANDSAALQKYQTLELLQRCSINNLSKAVITPKKGPVPLPNIDEQISLPVIDALTARSAPESL